jgi:hypothetical protein
MGEANCLWRREGMQNCIPSLLEGIILPARAEVAEDRGGELRRRQAGEARIDDGEARINDGEA